MEVLKSLGDFLLGIIKRLYWLIPSILVDPFDVIEKLTGNLLKVPPYVSWGLAGIGLFIAMLLAYHELRLKYNNLHVDYVEQEWNYTRRRRIELREPYLKQILPTLREMQSLINTLVNKADMRQVNEKILQDATDYICKEVGGLAGVKNTSEQAQNLFALEIANVLNAQEIGLATLKSQSQDWIKVMQRLDELRTSISDIVLNEMLKDYLIMLEGDASFELYGQYIDKCHGHNVLRDKAKSFGGKIGRDELQKKQLTKISKRIEQLLSGDETK